MEYPNYCYRYRPFSPLSLKEILYGEIFFASLDEINDPYDTIINYVFEADSNKFYRLVEFVIHNYLVKSDLLKKELITHVDINLLSNFLAKEERTYQELIAILSSDEFEDIFLEAFKKTKVPELLTLKDIFIRDFKYEIHKSVGHHAYISSFSKKVNDSIMWSHYADQHRGFCLQFKPLNGKIHPNPENKNKTFSKANPGELKEVIYSDIIQPLNGFWRFNRTINGHGLDKKENQEFWNSFSKSAITKSKNWTYENEVRLVYYDWMPSSVTTEGPVKLNSPDRIYYYDQTQLTGIIFGSRIKDDDIKTVVSTVTKLRDDLLGKAGGFLPVFRFYKATMNHRKYDLDIVLHSALDAKNHEFSEEIINEKIDEIENEYKKFSEIHSRAENKIKSYAHQKTWASENTSA